MKPIDQDLSEAVIVFLGFRLLAAPIGGGAERIAGHFGRARAAEFVSAATTIVDEMNGIPVDWSSTSLAEAGDAIRREMSARYPSLSEAALNALAWSFTYNWR